MVGILFLLVIGFVSYQLVVEQRLDKTGLSVETGSVPGGPCTGDEDCPDPTCAYKCVDGECEGRSDKNACGPSLCCDACTQQCTRDAGDPPNWRCIPSGNVACPGVPTGWGPVATCCSSSSTVC